MSDSEPPLQSLLLDPEKPYQGGALLANLVLFGRLCRGLGMQVSPARLVTAVEGLDRIQLHRKEDFRNVLQACLVTRPSEIPFFQEAFRLFWSVPGSGRDSRDLRSLGEDRLKKQERREWLSEEDNQDPGSREEDSPATPIPVYSRSESLRRKAFSGMEAHEMAAALDMIRRLSGRLPVRRSRRTISGQGRRLDLRKMLRSSLQFGGEPMLRKSQVRKWRERPLVLLADVSGSMEQYTRVLMHFAHTLSVSFRRVESFVFATRLTRISRALRRKSVDMALRDAGQLVQDWASGTDIGHALRTFNTHWGRRVLGHGAVVLLISDGWDRGAPEVLRAEIAHLQRACYRLIWLNPLLGEAHFQPRTRGALAMLPHVDEFLSIRNLASLDKLTEVLATLGRQPSRQHVWDADHSGARRDRGRISERG